MRIPVLKTDLPKKFNKVAKYIGRHWPAGKLSLSQSRETLAYLFGYNSMHEIQQVAESTTLPEDIEMSKAYSSIVGKALVKYGIRPESLSLVLNKAPFKELAFYETTDIEKERKYFESQRKKGLFMFADEFHQYSGYKSPKLIIEQHKEGLIPPYQYAVNQEGKIFSSSAYEALIKQLGSIEDLVDENEDIESVEKLIEEHILPMAWLPIKDYLAEGHFLRTPFMTEVYHVRYGGEVRGYMVKHLGYNGFYPRICKNEDELNQVLKAIYENKKIERGDVPSGLFNLMSALKKDIIDIYTTARLWSEENRIEEEISIDGQDFIRLTSYQGYPELESNPALSSHLWPSPKKHIILKNNELIHPETYRQHQSIDRFRSLIAQDSIHKITCAEDQSLAGLLNIIFENKLITLRELLILDYGQGYDLEDHEESNWIYDGKNIVKDHPELKPFFELDALGYLYQEFEEDINDYRGSRYQNERSEKFIAYVISKKTELEKQASNADDNLFATLLLVAHFSSKVQSMTFKLFQNYHKEITSMLSRHRRQDLSIKNMEKWMEHQKNIDPRYLSNGPLVEYQDRSYNEIMQDLFRLGRKYNFKIDQRGSK